MMHRPVRSPVRRGLALLVAGVCAVVLTAAQGAPSRSWSRPPADRGSAGILALDWGDIDATAEAWRGSYLVLQPWEAARIPALKEKNPRLVVLMYKDAAAVVRTPHESGTYATGLSYREAAEHGWLLHDGAGAIVEWADWAGLYPADLADPGYQDLWGDHVLAELGRGDWDGVMMDDTLTYLSHATVGDRVSTEIPTDEAMYAATESFLAEVAPRVRRAGFLAVPNLTVEWDTWHDVLTDWTPYVSGWENEYAVKWGLDRGGSRFVGADWEWKMRLAAWCADRGVPLLAITYSNRDDAGAQIYHRATWLLTWNGRTGASIFVPEEPFTDHWLPRATVDLGRPVARRERLDSGVWRRPYTGGVVLVNPTTGRRTVPLETRYRTMRGVVVDAVTLAPLSGAILRR